MKRKYIICICLITIITLIIGCLVLANNKEIEPDEKERFINNSIKLGIYQEDLVSEDNYIITSLDEYKALFKDEILREEDFEKYNYALIEIQHNSCSDKNLEIKGYKVTNNHIDINIEYEGSCGLCAPIYLYYAIPLDKEIKAYDVEFDYKMTNKPDCDPDIAYKPMIYLYPTKEMNVTVKLGNDKVLTSTYPKYESLWEVTAKEDGTLIDKKSNRKYYGLYWEGNNHSAKILDEGFIVDGSDTIRFLEEKLSILGLNELEANEFIVYWLPKLEHNKYNYIRFETIEEINNYMPLDITPKPDTVIRILMDYKPLLEQIEVKEQILTSPKREGFTVVEWGGSLID